MDIKKRIQQLSAQLKEYNKQYRLGNPQVSDAEYDRMVEELKSLDPDNAWLAQTEPAPVNNSRKRKLPIPMKSLNKVKSLTEVKSWLKSMAIPETHGLVIMPKYDGISWLRDECTHVTYSRGGAENEGQDCTNHFMFAKHALSVSSAMPFHFTFGELVFSVKEWETNFVGKVSDATGEKFKSPRNTVAGFINRDETTPLLRHAEFVRYGVGETDWQEYSTFSEVLSKLGAVYCGPNLAEYIKVQDLSEELLADLFKKWRKLYYIDGLVIYLNDLQLWKTLGRQQTTGNPLYAIAYKHPDFTDSFETTVKGIDWNISKAGALKPVVNIEAVDTGDCTMENPTGYNAKYVFENGIGPGAKIIVTRSGGVIPKILSVIEEAPTEAMMEMRNHLLYCQDCGKPTVWNDSKVELVCTNQDCPGITLAKVVHFYNTLDAEQMGEETIAKLFNAGYNTLRRILDVTFDELMLIDGFGESIANIILSTNKRIRDGVEVTKLMHSSDCFQGIGQVKAKAILSEMSGTDLFGFINGYIKFEDGWDTTEQFLALPKTKQSFLKGVQPFYDFVAKNRLKILPPEEAPKPTGSKYSGFNVCFTGIRDKELEHEIVLQGGAIVNGVSKNTTHLIVADLNTSSSKAIKAKALGIPIFTVETFKAL